MSEEEKQEEQGEKRVIVRLQLSTWKAYDDKRHAERTSFQRIGEALLHEWFAGSSPTTVEVVPEKKEAARDTAEFTSPLVLDLIQLIREIEACGRTDLVNIADAMLRQMATEARGGGSGKYPGVAEADAAIRLNEARERRIAEEPGEDRGDAKVPSVPLRHKKKTG